MISKRHEEWLMKIFDSDLYFSIFVAIVLGVCYLVVFLISHLCGIEGLTIMTTRGAISSTTAIFFGLILIPLLIFFRLFNV